MKSLPCIAGALALSFSSLHAQAPLAETIEVRVTSVDVAVVDKSGNPVPGLTSDDFELTESGVPQPITNFSEIHDSTATPRRLLIYVDGVSMNPAARAQNFAALEASLPSLIRAGDEAMLVFRDATGSVVTPFTGDHAELARRIHDAAASAGGAINPMTARSRIVEHATEMVADSRSPTSRKINLEQAYNESSKAARILAAELHASETAILDDARTLLTSLAGVDGKRAFVFIGSDLTANPGDDLIAQIDNQFYVFLRQAIRRGNRPVERRANASLAPALAALAREANLNGVTMYVVDTDRSRAADPGEKAAADADPTLAAIASTTGGTALAGKAIEKALGGLARDLSTYYSLGYRSPQDGDAERPIAVKVKRPGLFVRARNAYVGRSAEDELHDRVVANVYHAGVRSDFPVSIAAGTPERLDDGQYKVKVTVTFPSSMTFVPRDGSLAGEFAVSFATGREDGAISAVTRAVQPMKFPGNAAAAIAARKTFTYDAVLAVRPGQQVISVAVTDTLSNTSGFARTKIDAH